MSVPKAERISRLQMLSVIFRNPAYIAVALIGMAANYAIFEYILLASNKGVFLINAPIYLIYALLAAGGMLVAIAAYALRINTISVAERASEEAAGVLIPAIGSMLSSCACSYPIFASLLLAAGINDVAVSGLVSFVTAYQAQLLIAMLLINVAVIYYYLGDVAKGCSIRKKGKRH